MVHGHWNGKGITDPSVRALFTRDSLLASDWYRRRLQVKQERDIALWTRHAAYLKTFMSRQSHIDESKQLGLDERLQYVNKNLALVSSSKYIDGLNGTIGADPMGKVAQSMSSKG